MPKKRRNKNWSYNAGERGRNWVRAFQQSRDGRFYLEWMDAGKRTTIVLGSVTDLGEAKVKADELAARFTRPATGTGTTLDALLDAYLKEMTPTKKDQKQRHDRRATRVWREFFNAQPELDRGVMRDPNTLDRIDWDRFICARRGGHIPGWPRAVRDRAVEYDLKFLLAVLNWAVGTTTLKSSPWRPEIRVKQNWTMPKELNPKRPSMPKDLLEKLIKYAPGWQFEAMMRLQGETGRRNNAIRQLRWSDVDFTAQQVRWIPDADKAGKEGWTYMPEGVAAILRGLPSRGIGDLSVFPGRTGCTSRHTCQIWLRRAKDRLIQSVPEEERRQLASRLERVGYHSQKRSIVRATWFRALPPAIQGAYVGTDPRTLSKIYDEVTPEDQRAAFEAVGQVPAESEEEGEKEGKRSTTASTTASRREAGA